MYVIVLGISVVAQGESERQDWCRQEDWLCGPSSRDDMIEAVGSSTLLERMISEKTIGGH